MQSSSSQPRPRHTREDVRATALELLQNHGLAELTMRRLAGQLGVQPSALYWHVPNKQSLLADLADRIVARADLEQRDVLAVARALRSALLSCRDGAEVVSSSLALGLGGLAAQVHLSRAIRAGVEGISDDLAESAATILVHQILGQVWHEQQRQTAEQLGLSVSVGQGNPAEQVDLGVRLVLAGLAGIARDRTKRSGPGGVNSDGR